MLKMKMELKKYKKKRIVPQGWEEITLEDVFRTSSGATPLSTEVSYYANGTIPWINSGELDKPYIYNTMNFISQKGFEKFLVRRFILLIQYLSQCMVLLQVKLRYLKWKHVQTKLFVPYFQTKSIVLYFLNTALIRFMTIL